MIRIPAIFQYWLGVALFLLSFIGWPLSAFTFARSEPQFVLGLSWFAIILTAMTYINEAAILLKEEREEKDE